MNRVMFSVRGLVLALGLLTCAVSARQAERVGGRASTSAPVVASVSWRDALRQKPEWYAGPEAVRIADNLLLYQRASGGWPKNIDMARTLSEQERAALVGEKAEADSTIDNGATYTQLAYLARVYTAAKLERHREAFLKGVDYLLGAQYPNGGWPQYFPARKGYYTHITYNDDAMVGVLNLLRDIARRRAAYAFVDEARRRKAEEAVARGVECILKTQVVVAGKRTVWGAQHDELTLAPAPARKFEPVSLASRESVGIVRFLMGIEQPDARLIEAVESAVAWFRDAQLGGIRWLEQPVATKPGTSERAVVADPTAPPLWARFYEIGTNRPIFEGRDGVVRYNVMEIEAERRNGYGWYTEEPAKLLNQDYTAWRKRLHR